MATTIQIKRASSATDNDISGLGNLSAGELAVSYGNGPAHDNSGGRLFVGNSAGGGNIIIGGEYFTSLLDHAPGSLQNTSALITNSSGKLDDLKVDDIQIDGTTISSIDTNKNILITPHGTGKTVVSNLYIDDVNTTLEEKVEDLIGANVVGGTGLSASYNDTSGNTTLSLDQESVQDIVGAQIDTNGSHSGISVTYQDSDADGALDFSLTNTTVTAGSYGSSSAIPTFTVDAQGRLTAAGTASITTTLDIAADGGTDNGVVLGTDTLTITGGNGVTTDVSGDTITVNVDADQSGVVTAVGNLTVGSGSADASVQSDGDHNLVLKTGNATTGTVTLANGANGNIVIAPDGTGVVNVDTSRITGVSDPVNDDDAANKAYVDATKSGLDVKESVRIATTAALDALTYTQANGKLTKNASGNINSSTGLGQSVTLVANDRVLVKDQAETRQNGIYVITTVGDGSNAFILTRASDADTGAEFTGGSFTFVEEGTNGENGYVFTHNGASTLNDGTLNDNTQLTVSQFSGAGQISPGTGLTKSGNTIDAVGSSTILANANSLEVNSSGTQYQILVSGGTAGNAAAWGTLPLGESAAVSGTLAVGTGGTGLASYTAGDMMYASGTTTIAKLAKGTANQFMTTNGSVPSWTSTIDAGTF